MKRSLFTSLFSMVTPNKAMTSTVNKPALRGVAFDMDGTLTIPNLDFSEMYRRCGVDSSKDILEEVAAMSKADQERANDIIEEMEEEGRRTLQLMPGAMELCSWLTAHNIPMALVTRNTRKSANVLTEKLLHNKNFHPVIARDDGFPPKPSPVALEAIAKTWSVELPSDSILMVGDSVSNDIVFGINAGVKPALLDTDGSRRDHEPKPDFSMTELTELPGYLYSNYCIESQLEKQAISLQGMPPPEPTTELTKAAARGDFPTITELSREESFDINAADDCGNSALIWATENNHTRLVQSLLELFSTTLNLNHQGYLGSSAVSRAARRGNCEIMSALAQAGADLDLPNRKLQYPLHFAAFQEHEALVRILLENGANKRVLDRKGRSPDDDTQNKSIRKMILEFSADKVPT